MGKTEIELNKPVYCGASILDLSKYHMFDFHYNYAKQKWKDLKVLYTDTDSLIYDIPTTNVFEDISGDIEKWYDTSGYPPDFPIFQLGRIKKYLEFLKMNAVGK